MSRGESCPEWEMHTRNGLSGSRDAALHCGSSHGTSAYLSSETDAYTSRTGIRTVLGYIVDMERSYRGILPCRNTHTMDSLRRSLALALLMIAPLLALHAQEIRLGGGYSGSKVDADGSDNWRGRAGYQYGLEVLLGGRFFVKPGIYMQIRNLDYTTTGLGQDGISNGITTETRYTSKALRIPLMGGIRLIDTENDPDFNLYATAGPTALIGLNAEVGDNSLNFTTRSTQWYIGFGAGVEYRFIFLDAGYDVGMTNMFNGDGINTNPRINNSYITAGLRFVLNK